MIDNLEGIREKINPLRENILYLISFKHLVDTNPPENSASG